MSPRAPGFGAMKAKKLKKILKTLGYQEVRQIGSHVTMECEGRPPVTLAFHNGVEVGGHMVRTILVQQAGRSLEEALEVYRRG